MVRLKEEKTKQLGKVTPSLNKKLVDYCKLIGVKKIDLLEELINKELEGKVLNKDFIVPEKPFYFNMGKLLEEGTVKASGKPSTDFKSYYTVKKIPHNLDSKNKKFKTYCYSNNEYLHKGLYIYYILCGGGAEPMALVFDFYTYDSKYEELVISNIDLNDLRLLIETEEDVETVEGIINKMEYNVKRYDSLMASGKFIDTTDGSEDSIFYNNFILENCEVIEDFKGRRQIELLSKYGIDEFSKLENEETVDSDSITLDSITTTEDVYNSAIEKELKYNEVASKLNSLQKDLKDIYDIFKNVEELSTEEVLEKVRIKEEDEVEE